MAINTSMIRILKMQGYVNSRYSKEDLVRSMLPRELSDKVINLPKAKSIYEGTGGYPKPPSLNDLGEESD